MRQNYAKAYKIVRGYEGGNVDNPKDPGGRTSRGVTQRVYNAYRAKMGKPTRDVYKADDKEVAEIFKKQYWDTALCDQLPSGIDLIVFDTAINSGGKRSYKLLQASLNRLANARLNVEGTPGMVTVEAAESAPDHDAVVLEFGKKRQAFYKALKTYKTFGKGWTKRNKNVTAIGTAWATGSVGPQPITAPMLYGAPADRVSDAADAPNAGMNAKALDGDIPQEYVGTGGSTGITAGSLAGNGGIEQFQQQIVDTSATLEPLSYMIDWVQYGLVALTLAGVGLGFYAWWRQRKFQRINESIDSAEIPGFGEAEPA